MIANGVTHGGVRSPIDRRRLVAQVVDAGDVPDQGLVRAEQVEGEGRVARLGDLAVHEHLGEAEQRDRAAAVRWSATRPYAVVRRRGSRSRPGRRRCGRPSPAASTDPAFSTAVEVAVGVELAVGRARLRDPGRQVLQLEERRVEHDEVVGGEQQPVVLVGVEQQVDVPEQHRGLAGRAARARPRSSARVAVSITSTPCWRSTSATAIAPCGAGLSAASGMPASAPAAEGDEQDDDDQHDDADHDPERGPPRGAAHRRGQATPAPDPPAAPAARCSREHPGRGGVGVGARGRARRAQPPLEGDHRSPLLGGAGAVEVAHAVEVEGGGGERARAASGKTIAARRANSRAVVPGKVATSVRSASPRAIERNSSAIAVV